MFFSEGECSRYGSFLTDESSVQLCMFQLDQARQQLETERAGLREEFNFILLTVKLLFNQPNTINLLNISPRNNVEFNRLLQFLSPYGFFWKVVLKLEESGVIFQHYKKRDLDGNKKAVGCVEFVISSFADHLRGAPPLQTMNVLSCPTDSVYFSLLQDYTVFFLPTEQAFPVAQLLDRSSILSSSNRFFRKSVQQETPLMVKNRLVNSPLGLFNKSVFHSAENTDDLDIFGHESIAHKNAMPSSRIENSNVLQLSWTFVKALIEVWTDFGSDQSSCQLSNSLQPSVAVVTALRYLIKQVHVFVGTPVSVGANPALNEMKSLIIPSLIEMSLFHFLSSQFDQWPLDASFRHILETWFTYIQPWRYTAGYVESSAINLLQWESFIRSNYKFYTTLFRKAISRFLRIDLSTKNIVLVARFVKVFGSQPDIIDIAEKKAEEAFSNVSTRQTSNIAENGHNYRKLLNELYLAVERARLKLQANVEVEEVRLEQEGNEGRQSSWLAKLVTFASDGSNAYLDELKRNSGQLQQLAFSLITCFHLNSQELIVAADSIDLIDHRRSISAGSRLPDHFVDSDTKMPKLTPLGRAQVMQKKRHFDFDDSYEMVSGGHSPLNQWEVRPLCRVLWRVSDWLNQTRFVHRMASGYDEESLRGRLARCLLDPATDQSPSAGLNLRYLSDFRLLLILAFAVLFSRYYLRIGLFPTALLLNFLSLCWFVINVLMSP